MTSSNTKYRTLIADDEQPARDRLKNLLSEHTDKIEVIGEAQNGIECRELIDRLRPDLVFLDIQMPGLTVCFLSGLKTFSIFRQRKNM